MPPKRKAVKEADVKSDYPLTTRSSTRCVTIISFAFSLLGGSEILFSQSRCATLHLLYINKSVLLQNSQ